MRMRSTARRHSAPIDPMPAKRLASGDDRRFTRADGARVLGIALIVAASLMLTFTPQLLFEATQREGYRRSEVELLSDSGRQRSVRVRIAADDTELRVKSTTFDAIVAHAHVPVWYNRQALLAVGTMTFLDARVINRERSPDLPELWEALLAVAINLVLATAGIALIFRRLKRQPIRETRHR
jgi:hypothetical protein